MAIDRNLVFVDAMTYTVTLYEFIEGQKNIHLTVNAATMLINKRQPDCFSFVFWRKNHHRSAILGAKTLFKNLHFV